MDNQIIIKNKIVCEFYKTHTWLSVENMNVIMVELLEKMIQGVQPSFNDSLITQLLAEINGMKEFVSNSQNQIHNEFTTKFSELRKEYLRDIQLLISSNTTEKLGPLIQQYNGSLEDKLRILIHELLPKTQEGVAKEVAGSLRELHHNVQKETQSILSSSINKKTLDEFVTSMDNKFAKSLISSQTFLNTMLTSTEQRLTHKLGEDNQMSLQKIQDMESNIKLSQVQQIALNTTVSELLKKLENSSVKGKVSENLLQNVLHHLYPTAQIEYVGTTKETGDIMVYREEKPVILFENKNHDRNVVQEEVKKFLRDTEIQNCSGIMCAQHYGIANKDNYQIDVHNGNVLVYLHCVEYNPEKLKIAVDIIDHFKMTIDDLEYSNETIHIEKSGLDLINKEYQQFVHLKLSQVKTVKEYSQKLLSQLEELKLPQLEHILNKHFASTVSKENLCEYCQYIAKNPRALTAHQRGCSEKKRISHN